MTGPVGPAGELTAQDLLKCLRSSLGLNPFADSQLAKLKDALNAALAAKAPQVGGAGELTAAIEAALAYLNSFEIEHSPDCSYGATNGPHGDFCDCGLTARRAKRVQVYSQLQVALAAKAPQGLPTREQFEHALYEDWCDEPLTHNDVMRVFDAACAGDRPSSESGGLAANPGYPAPESTGGPQKMAALPVPGPVSDDTIHHGMDSQTICRKLDAVALHLNLKGRPQSLDIATAVRLVEEGAEWAAKHIEERGRELDKLRATLNKVAKDIDGTSPNGESIARERIQSVLRPKPAPAADEQIIYAQHPLAGMKPANRSLAEKAQDFEKGMGLYAVPAPGAERLRERITEYLAHGGLFNPESVEHAKVRELLIDVREALAAAPPAPTKETIMDIIKRAHELVEAHSMPLGTKEPTSWPCKIACKCGTQIEAINRDALTLMFVNHVVMEALADRHASAERVRELIAKWRDRVENAPKAFTGPRRPIGDLNRFDALNRFERRMLGWCAGELERALPPSTGEKAQNEPTS